MRRAGGSLSEPTTPPRDPARARGSTEIQPLRGFEDVAPHVLHGPSGFRIWFTEPLGILTQIGTQTRADEHMGAVLTGPVTQRLLALRRGPDEKLHFTHEWSRLESYTTQLRADLTKWGVGLRGDIAKLTVVLAPSTTTIVRMGIDVAAVGLRIAGINLDVSYDFRDVQRKLDLRPHRDVTGTVLVD
jgi:hypothetical protein